MEKTTTGKFTEEITLQSDNGTELHFYGRMYSESSHFDEDTATLTRLRLYVTSKETYVYSIVSSSGAVKKRRLYVISPEGTDIYRLSDGIMTMTVSLDLLFASVFGLCGIDTARADELKPEIEESLRMLVG